jgi:hypothetical protein
MISQCALHMALSAVLAFLLGLFFKQLVAGTIKLIKLAAVAGLAILFLAGLCCLLGLWAPCCNVR